MNITCVCVCECVSVREGMDRIHVTQNIILGLAFVIIVMNVQVPQKAENDQLID
jgi:hypothetical protein